MSEQSAKPYLIRAICEWCADNGLTPYIAVKVSSQTRVPAAFVKNGEIVLINSQTERLFGYTRDELLGKFIEILVPGRFRQHC